MRTKDTIKFSGFYLGDNKPAKRKGHRIWIEYYKRDIILGYERLCAINQLNNAPKISLLMYVREMVNEIYLTGELKEIEQL